jgi:hypothetical protein
MLTFPFRLQCSRLPKLWWWCSCCRLRSLWFKQGPEALSEACLSLIKSKRVEVLLRASPHSLNNRPQFSFSSLKSVELASCQIFSEFQYFAYAIEIPLWNKPLKACLLYKVTLITLIISVALIHYQTNWITKRLYLNVYKPSYPHTTILKNVTNRIRPITLITKPWQPNKHNPLTNHRTYVVRKTRINLGLQAKLVCNLCYFGHMPF